jgi:Zn finger protein HypA/HybF involved in hydrogenase expression
VTSDPYDWAKPRPDPEPARLQPTLVIDPEVALCECQDCGIEFEARRLGTDRELHSCSRCHSQDVLQFDDD